MIIVSFKTINIIAFRACQIMTHFDLSQKFSFRVVFKELNDESRVSPLI